MTRLDINMPATPPIANSSRIHNGMLRGEKVYTSVLQLVRERLNQKVTTLEQARDLDPDDIGGI